MTTRHTWPADGCEPPPPVVSRRAELWLTGIGAVLATVFLGGFAAVMSRVDQETFDEVVRPVMLSGGDELTAAEAFEAGRTLSAWFGFTLLLVLALAAVAVLAMRRRPHHRSTAWWLLAAGLVCLLGSQLIAYPIAFFFFLGAGLLAARPVRDGSPA